MTIKKGTHKPFRIPMPVVFPATIGYKVNFTESCRYDIGEDQSDINKLFGIGYFPTHHSKSVRIGWNYNRLSDKINLWAYWYDNGKRRMEFLSAVPMMKIHYLRITQFEDYHVIQIPGIMFDVLVRPQTFGYTLGLYFGGNQKAPHDMRVDMEML